MPPASCTHSKVPAGLDVNSKVALVWAIGPAGPRVIVVSGSVVSIVHV
jgi:hypothetical protein